MAHRDPNSATNADEKDCLADTIEQWQDATSGIHGNRPWASTIQRPGLRYVLTLVFCGTRRRVALRNDNAELMRAVESGDTFIITLNGVPVGGLTPVPRRTFAPTKALRKPALLPRIEYARLRADLHAHIDEDPTPVV